MASDLVRTKDLPVVDQYSDVSMDDRVIASHVTSGDNRQTVGITVGALGEKFLSESAGSPLFPRNLFGEGAPSNNLGNPGDLYFSIESDVITSGYFKYGNIWKQFKVSDDNWNKFLAGQEFDVISDAKSIKAYAFDGNTLIRRVIIPQCETIYEYAFRSSSIRSLVAPKLEYIAEGVFKWTNSWVTGTVIDLPSIKTIGAEAFSECINDSTTRWDINIQNVEEIGGNAFFESGRDWYFLPYSSTKGRGLYLPRCVSIAGSAFSIYTVNFRHNFHYIVLPSIETIGDQAFRNLDFCGTNESHCIIEFGENITTIGNGIFYAASENIGQRSNNTTGAYVDLYIEAVDPPALSSRFAGDSGGVMPAPIFYPNIYVPEQSVNVYKNANVWSTYADYIQAIPPEGVPVIWEPDGEEEE